MSRQVRLSPRAKWDLSRLANFLAERDGGAARRMSAILLDALSGLEDFAERAPLADAGENLREMRVRFGRYGYAIQYVVESDVVLVVQIFHVREAR